MRIVISSTGANLKADVDPRFGRAAFLLLYDTDKKEVVEVIDNGEGQDAAQGAGISVASLLAQKGVAVIITGRVGPKAMKVVRKAGIKVVSNATGTVEGAVSGFSGQGASGQDNGAQDERKVPGAECRRRNVWQKGGGPTRMGRGYGGRGRGQVSGR
ncbi:MAG: NifB/NifX family molybdenum-iron cluster-binding protein [Thermodesulfobacteriota bacterium]